jgi:hypothetical protein
MVVDDIDNGDNIDNSDNTDRDYIIKLQKMNRQCKRNE